MKNCSIKKYFNYHIYKYRAFTFKNGSENVREIFSLLKNYKNIFFKNHLNCIFISVHHYRFTNDVLNCLK